MDKELQLINIIENKQGLERDQAFSVLFDQYYSIILARVKSQINSVEDAEEITMDVFNKAYHWLKDGKRKYGTSVKPFLLHVSKNLVINHYKKKSIFTYMEELDQNQSVTPEVEKNINDAFVKELLLDLPPKQKRTYELFVLGFSHKEIAEMVPWENDKSSKSQLSKIRKIITEKFKSYKR